MIYPLLRNTVQISIKDDNDLSKGTPPVGRSTWTLAESKARLTKILDRAVSEGPQIIIRKGRAAAVVVGAEEWRRKTRRTCTLAEFFRRSPLRGSELKVRPRKERRD